MDEMDIFNKKNLLSIQEQNNNEKQNFERAQMQQEDLRSKVHTMNDQVVIEMQQLEELQKI